MTAGAPVAPAAAVTAPPAWRSLYPFRSRFLELGPHRMHYLDEGPRHAPPLVLLHGNPTWSFYWREVVLAFRDRFRVVAPDHLGCGLSDKPQRWSYRLSDHVSNLERLVDALGLRELTLVVHDWGGAIGMGLAVRQPQRVARLVVTNTAAFRSARLPLRIAACRLPLLGPLLVRGLNGFALVATRMATTRRLEPLVAEGLLAPYARWSDRVGVLGFVRDIPMDAAHPSWRTLVEIEAGLERLRDKPTLILWGERDFVFTTAFRDEWVRRFPNAAVVSFAGAGHYLVEDARPQLMEALSRFLAAPVP